MTCDDKILKLARSNDAEKRDRGAFLLRRYFSLLINKHQAEEVLLRLTRDKNYSVREHAILCLGEVFSHLPDKQLAWEDLHRHTLNKNHSVKWEATLALGLAYQHVPDKQTAWKVLHRLTLDEDLKQVAAIALGDAYPHVPDKQIAWKVLYRLTRDKQNVRGTAASAIRKAFPYVPDKQQAWKVLYRLTRDENIHLRDTEAFGLRSVFPYVPDKQQAWNDLLFLTRDKHFEMRKCAAFTMGFVFSNLSDKQQAWKDLVCLTRDESEYVRRGVAEALGFVFPYVSDKQQAWKVLHCLIRDESEYVRRGAAKALGLVFPHVPDKQQAWNDLIHLTQDEEYTLRASAYYSLGRISIFKATETLSENEFKEELKKALVYFENSLKENWFRNTAEFCLSLYRSFFEIIFNKQKAEVEIEIGTYLSKAKDTVHGRENRGELYIIVENLANILHEVQNAREMGLKGMKYDLNKIRMYFEISEKLLDSAEENTPEAAKFMRIGIPTFKKSIRELLDEIKEISEITCQQSKGRPAEEIARVINREIQKWQISDQEQMTNNVDKLISILKSKISLIPENKPLNDKIEDVGGEYDLTKQYVKIIELIELIPTMYVHIGDNYKISNVNGEKFQIGNNNKINENKSDVSKESNKKLLIERFNPPATFAAFIGFLITEIGTYFYSISYNHLISVVVALFVFVIGATLSKR